jgi:hypothetical protein
MGSIQVLALDVLPHTATFHISTSVEHEFLLGIMIILYYAYAGICGLMDGYCFTKATVCIAAAPPTAIPHRPAPHIDTTNWLNDVYLNLLTSAAPIFPRFTKSGAIAQRIDPSDGHLPQHPRSPPLSSRPSLPPCPGHTKSLSIFHIILSRPYHVHDPHSPTALANWPLAMIPTEQSFLKHDAL